MPQPTIRFGDTIFEVLITDALPEDALGLNDGASLHLFKDGTEIERVSDSVTFGQDSRYQ